MFVRRKYIKGNPYGYLVENEWTKKGPRQKVLKYLGRIIDVEEQPALDTSSLSVDSLLQEVILYEVPTDVDIDFTNRSVTKNDKRVVLGMNSGVLCDETLQEVFSSLHKRNESRPGLAFATALKNAGVRIDRQDFIRLYLSVH